MTASRSGDHTARHEFKHSFFAFDNMTILLAVILCLMWTWGSISAMSRNWALSEELAERQRQKALLELEVETIELENAYYQSDEYKELAARRYQNKKLPGETMIYLSENSESARNKHTTTVVEPVASEPTELSNIQQWFAFLFGA